MLSFLYAFYIDASDLGEYEYVQTLVYIIAPIFFVSIWEGVLKFILSENNEEIKRKIITTSALFSIVASAVIAVVFGIYYTFISKKGLYTIYFLLTYILNGLVWVWQNYAKSLDKNRIYIKSSIIGSAINILTVVLLVIFCNMKLHALFISNILGILTTFFVIEKDLKVFSNIKKSDIDIPILKKMIKYSFPLIINMISVWVITGFGKIIIQNVLGAEANGAYSFANKFTVIITFIGTILNMAITEEMLRLGKEGVEKDFSQILQQLTEKFLALAIISLPLIRIFYEFIKKTGYYESKIYIPLLLVYSIIIVIVNSISAVFKVYEKTKHQSIATTIGAIGSIIIMLSTIHIWGIMGVVIGQICGATVNMLAMFIFMKKYSQTKFNYKNIIILIILYILLALVVY